jgi:hypothetical protein
MRLKSDQIPVPRNDGSPSVLPISRHCACFLIHILAGYHLRNPHLHHQLVLLKQEAPIADPSCVLQTLKPGTSHFEMDAHC